MLRRRGPVIPLETGSKNPSSLASVPNDGNPPILLLRDGTERKNEVWGQSPFPDLFGVSTGRNARPINRPRFCYRFPQSAPANQTGEGAVYSAEKAQPQGRPQHAAAPPEYPRIPGTRRPAGVQNEGGVSRACSSTATNHDLFISIGSATFAFFQKFTSVAWASGSASMALLISLSVKERRRFQSVPPLAEVFPACCCFMATTSTLCIYDATQIKEHQNRKKAPFLKSPPPPPNLYSADYRLESQASPADFSVPPTTEPSPPGS